jgi:hypothetical protein
MHGIGEFWGYPERRAFAELLIGWTCVARFALESAAKGVAGHGRI